MSASIISILTVIFALGAAVVAFIFIVPEKKRAKLNTIGKLLHDLFNFKFLIIEKIFQFCYIFATASCIISGFFTLFSFEDRYYGYGVYSSEWVGWYGFLIMILGPIAVRIVYEIAMMAVLAVKNIIQINNKLKNQNEDADEASPFGIPSKKDYVAEQAEEVPAAPVAPVAPVAPAAPVSKFCTKCGAPNDANGICTNPACPK